MNVEPGLFLNELENAIKSDKLVLPSLPDVALKIRDAMESESSCAESIANIISQDGSLSVRLLKVVNSPLYRSRTPIGDLQMAVTRLGIRMVRDLVMNLAMKQMFQATSGDLDEKFRATWNTSVDVAAICNMLAQSMSGIKKEEALLAGLIHNIGALPILQVAEHEEALFGDNDALNSLIWELQGSVSALILRNWHFSDELVEVVRECHNFSYDNGPEAKLTYLVQVTLLQGGFVPEEHRPADWANVPAFAHLGMGADHDIIDIEDNEEIQETREALMF